MRPAGGGRDGGAGGGALALLVLPALAALVLFPLVFVVLQAVFPEIGRGSFADAFSAVPQALGDPRIARWTANTALLGLSVAAASALVGVPLGVLRGLFRVPFAGVWDLVFLAPFAIPPYIAAIGWIMTLQRGGYLHQLLGFDLGSFLFSFRGVVFVMTLNVFPVVYFAVSRTVGAVGGRYAEAGRVCGAGPFRTFLRITLPLSTPAVAASLLLVFAMAVEEFGTPYVLASRSGFTVLVTAIEQRLADWPIDLPGAAALSLILLALALGAFLLQLRIVGMRDFRTIGGRAGRQEPRPLGAWAAPVLCLFAAVGLVATAVPVAAVLLTASTRTISGGLAWSNVSAVHFQAVLANRAGALDALGTSLGLGVGAALLTGLVGTLAAVLVVRSRTAATKAADFLTLAPSAVPGIVMAVGLILAWNQPWLPATPYNTVWVLLIAYCCLLLPYPVRYAGAALRQMGPSLEDAGRVAGAAGAAVLIRIVLPLILPSVVAAMLLVFAVAARELVATVLLAPVGTRTTALFIWRQFEQGSVGLGMAMASVTIAITMTIPVAVMAWARRRGALD